MDVFEFASMSGRATVLHHETAGKISLQKTVTMVVCLFLNRTGSNLHAATGPLLSTKWFFKHVFHPITAPTSSGHQK